MATTHPPAIISVTNTDDSKPSKQDRPPIAARAPSLNQLAARINANAPLALTSNQSSRPRLAASLLRTGSSVSLTNSTISAATADSLAVNAPSTRSGSPSVDDSSRSSSPSVSSTVGLPTEGGDLLTTDKLDKHNADAEKKVKIGYKNVPSLQEITVRLAMARSLSIDGTPRPPEPETFEDPKTPGIPVKAPEHPLQSPWTIYHDSKAKAPSSGATGEVSPNNPQPVTESGTYEAGLTVIGEFDTVESFCRYFNWLKPPSKLERNSNYHLFKSGIKPMWEDPANANGGKWVLTTKGTPALLDRCWSWLTMAMVGEDFDEGYEICGAVVSLRSKVDRIQLWIRSKDDVERINSIGRKLIKLLDISEADGVGLEFQYNSDDRPPPNKFISIQASFPQSGFRSTFPHQGEIVPPNPSNLAFGAFGTGGAFGGGWRGRRT